MMSQFRVHRDRIRRWPRQFYQEALREYHHRPHTTTTVSLGFCC